MKEKIAFPELVALVAQKASTTERMSELFLQELFATVTQELNDGHSVKIKGIGTFKTKKIDGETTVMLVPDKELAQAVNAPFEQFRPVVLSEAVTQEQLDEIDASMKPKQEAVEPPEPDVELEQETTEQVIKPETPQPQAIEPAQEEEKDMEQPIAPATSLAQPQQAQPSQPKKQRKPLWIAIAAAALLAVVIGAVVRNSDTSHHSTTTPVATHTIAAATQPVVVTDTLGSHNLLYDMAERHYGDRVFWAYIAIENQDKYPNFKKIPAGAVLVIPPAEKYGINSDSKLSTKRAAIESTKLYKLSREMDKKEKGDTATTNSKSYKKTISKKQIATDHDTATNAKAQKPSSSYRHKKSYRNKHHRYRRHRR